MGGICGFINTNEIEQAELNNIINRMSEKIMHRGPDSSGVFSDGYYNAGFRRLSIIDLEDGSQPIYNEDESILVTLNGEIYNHEKLREDLAEKGHIFKTRSDTETLVHLYEEYGDDMVIKLRGMFAFVIYDIKNKKLFGARDYFGIKPFYYYQENGGFMYASEIKSLLEHPDFIKELNEEALENYLTFQYSVLSESFFKGVHKLLPSHCFTYIDGKMVTKRYYDPIFRPVDNTLTNTVNFIEEAMQSSIKAHKVSDVEVGSFLSSGVDSSFITACANIKKTFTVGFDYEKYNEVDYAKDFSKEIDVENYNKLITKDEYWDSIPRVMYHMDEPLADPAAVALYFVAELASLHVKVVLSGEGADEFFGGYNIYREPLDLKLVTDLPMWLRKILMKAATLIPVPFKGKNYLIRASKNIEERFIGNTCIFSVEERSKILKHSKGTNPSEITKPYFEKAKHLDDITKMQYVDMNLRLVGDILLKADKMSMAHSLEVRVPFLDKRVFKAASRTQADFRVNRTATKYAFRLVAKDHVPLVVAEKKKLGFSVPISIWLKDEKYYNKVLSTITSPDAAKYFHIDGLKKLLEDHKNGAKNNCNKLWTVYCFMIWHEQFFGSNK